VGFQPGKKGGHATNARGMAQAEWTTCSAAMEEWLSSASATDAFEEALEASMSAEGGGSHGRNLSFDQLVAVCQLVVERLPQPLDQIIPPPDAKFVGRAVASTLPDVVHSGLRDSETLTMAVQAVFVMLASSVDILNEAMAAKEARETL
jgi:hypothetical protein